MDRYKLQQLAYGAYLYPALWAQKKRPFGLNIFERQWDLLIILDACRVDALHEIKHEYDYIQSINSHWSVGSTSKEWIMNTFDKEHEDQISETALVTGNGWAEKMLENTPEWGRWTALNDSYWEHHPVSKFIARDIVSSSHFHSFVPVWSDNFSEANNRAPRAEAVTDAAITVSRNECAAQMIVHYMQPHAPYFCDIPSDEKLPEINRKPLKMLENGTKKERIWDLYIDNLRYVLDSVEVLLDNSDAEKVVITADHGELFGELGLYGHVAGLPYPQLRKVPWVVTEAADQKKYEPDYNIDERSSTNQDVEKRLEDLGYV